MFGENKVGTGSGTRLSGRENTGGAASFWKLRWLPESTTSYERSMMSMFTTCCRGSGHEHTGLHAPKLDASDGAVGFQISIG